MINRSQFLVLGFFVGVWIVLVTILTLAPEIYVQMLNPPQDARMAVGLGLLVALTALIAFLVVAVLQRWRWAFWLVVGPSWLAFCECLPRSWS